MKKLCLLLATVLCTGCMFTFSACSQVDIVGSVYDYDSMSWEWSAGATEEDKSTVLTIMTEDEITKLLCDTTYYILCATRFVIVDRETLMFGYSDAMVMLSYSRNNSKMSLELPSELMTEDMNVSCTISADSLVMDFPVFETQIVPITAKITYVKKTTEEAPEVAGKTFKATEFESSTLLDNIPDSVLIAQTEACSSLGGIAAYIKAAGEKSYESTTDEGVKTITFAEDGTYTQVMKDITYTGKYFISGNYVYAYVVVEEADIPIAPIPPTTDEQTPPTDEQTPPIEEQAPTDELNVKACLVSTYYMVDGNLKQYQVVPDFNASFSAVYAYTEVTNL